MKLIMNNKYIKCTNYQNENELYSFLEKYKEKQQLFINYVNENKYYFSLTCYHSLLDEIQYILSFSSDNKNFELLLWDTTSQIVLYTGTDLYLIDENFKSRKIIEYMSPLIGLLISPIDNLIVLEEISLKIIDRTGKIILKEQFDLIEDYNIIDDKLHLQTEEGIKIIRIF